MKNLEQRRAAHALNACKDAKFRGVNDGEVVKKIPPLIMDNGILASMAFACEKKAAGFKNPGHNAVFLACIDHLQKNGDFNIPENKCDDVRKFLGWIAGKESGLLRAITAETLAYLAYLRRFAKKEEKTHG